MRARHGEPAAGGQRQAHPAEQHLERRSVLGVAHEPVREAVSRAVEGARTAHAEVPEARAPEILHEGAAVSGEHPHDGVRSGRARESVGGAHHGTTRVKRTRVPGVTRAGSARAASHSTASVVPMSCQPPGELRG